MILCFELSMPNRGSWNGKWSQENDLHIITKTDRQIGKNALKNLTENLFITDGKMDGVLVYHAK
ncbi:MAG: hypothetical protein IKF39_01140 [Oscillospiraceae bacterium]|nr:hypothetical protein [Oscillospiraceae bacterium]